MENDYEKHIDAVSVARLVETLRGEKLSPLEMLKLYDEIRHEVITAAEEFKGKEG